MSRFRAIFLPLGGMLFLLFSGEATAQGTLSTIFTNGPIASRLNVVLLSEGYTTNQLGQFLTDATSAVSNLLSVSPYSEYSNYFNAFAISVASVNSGSKHPVSGVTNINTYFNSTYGDNILQPQQLITIPPDNPWDTNYNDGKGKGRNLLTNLIPGYDFVLLVVNDFEYGGSGEPPATNNPLPVAITSLGTYAPQIVVHESAHTLGGLADEFTNAWPGFVPVEMPNVTAQTNRALIKWNSWISSSTPVPTPDVPTNSDVIGLFKGAEYQMKGWYRPKHDCQMNNPYGNVPFCEVCSEQLVKSIYSFVRPIDSCSPASTNFSLVTTQMVSFNVMPMQPSTHNLAIQWYTNNVAVSVATNAAFQFLPQLVGNGTCAVRVVVSDPTPLVRNDPTGLLRATNTWLVNVSINQLWLINALALAGGNFRLTVTGSALQGFVIQASPNLSNWSPLSTNTLVSGQFDYTNSGLLAVPNRFYRTLSPP